MLFVYVHNLVHIFSAFYSNGGLSRDNDPNPDGLGAIKAAAYFIQGLFGYFLIYQAF